MMIRLYNVAQDMYLTREAAMQAMQTLVDREQFSHIRSQHIVSVTSAIDCLKILAILNCTNSFPGETHARLWLCFENNDKQMTFLSLFEFAKTNRISLFAEWESKQLEWSSSEEEESDIEEHQDDSGESDDEAEDDLEQEINRLGFNLGRL